MLQGLLVSLSQGSRVPDETLVVDNDPELSADPTPVPGLVVRVVPAALGISLSGARNAGWRAASCDICIFIDDDNVVERDAIDLLARACLDSDVGLAGPVILAGDNEEIWCAGIIRSQWTGQTRCILSGETIVPEHSVWETDDMPDAFAVPRAVLEKLDGFDDKNFPIHYDESDFTARIRKLGLRNIVVGDAIVRHYGWVGVSPGRAMVRASASHGTDRVRQMGLSRVRYHTMHATGLRRASSVGVFLPVWVGLTFIGCLRVDEPWNVRLATMRAVGSGVLDGYREAYEKRQRVEGKSGMDQKLATDSDWAESEGLVGSVLPPVRMFAANLVKSFAYYSGLHRLVFYRYDYMFRPRELALLVSSLTETQGMKGPIFEIGCAAGHTTVYLNKHLDDSADPRDYFCLDTFAGFTDDDIAVEIERGHTSNRYNHLFRAYRQSWFDQTMRNNHVTRVTSIQADVNSFDFGPYHDISFCLIDVDLMRPVKKALEEVFPRMAPGGIILVDDCVPDAKYDGAWQGYVDFVKSIGFPVDIREGKQGMIRIPAA
jgi:O-methyltransferase